MKGGEENVVITGGRRHGTKRKSRYRKGSRNKKHMKGGCHGIIAHAALPFTLFALQRLFQGNTKTRKNIKKFGSKVKNVFQR